MRASNDSNTFALGLKPRSVPELGHLPALAKDHDRPGPVRAPRRPAHVDQALARRVLQEGEVKVLPPLRDRVLEGGGRADAVLGKGAEQQGQLGRVVGALPPARRDVGEAGVVPVSERA